MRKIKRPLEFLAVPIHRREDCARYETCLEEASVMLWPSFSCVGCRIYCFRRSEARLYHQATSPSAWEV